MACPFHGAHLDLTSRYNGGSDDFYLAKKTFHDGWEKERLAASLCESNITYLHVPLKEVFEWFYDNVGDLTQTPFVKDAFANLVFIRHKGKKGSQTSCLQVGCDRCCRMSAALYYADSEAYQKITQRVVWDFLSPYHDGERRVAFWQQFYVERSRSQHRLSLED